MDIQSFLLSKSFSESEAIKISSVFRAEPLTKGRKLSEPDSNSKKVYFVDEGLLRAFYLKDGRDVSHHFFQENDFALSLDSIFYARPSPYGLESLEAGTVFVAYYADIERMAEGHPGLQKLISFLLIDVLRAFSERLYAIQFQTALDRYKSIEANYPELLLRAPLGHIASYLGITQQTLSVLRARK